MDQDTVQTAVDSVVPFISKYGLQVIGAIVILIVGKIISSIAGKAVGAALDRAKADPGPNGFALQGSLSNFASGVMILVFRPFRVDDLIEAEGKLGTVADIGIFVTTINTLDNKKVIIPNGKLTSGVIVNLNANGLRRVDLMAGISYTDDIPKAMKILERILAENPRVLKDPEPTVAVFELGDSSVNFVVRPWVDPDDYWTVWFEVTQAMKMEFDAAGVTIPFPQRDVHMHQVAS